MKRILLTIFAVAIFAGVFAPVTASLSQDREVRIAMQSAQAAEGDILYAPTDSAERHIKDCGIFSGEAIGACFTKFFYYIPFSLGSWAMSMAAQAFDTSAKFTLSSTLYTAGTFLEEGWRITRDFANIFFILILLFIALSLVLDMEIGHANPKKMLAHVVVIAVLINFSFFITEVVIDISNSLALVFYNQVTIVSKLTNEPIEAKDENAQLKGDPGDEKTQSKYITEIKPLSISIVRAFTPQVLSDPEFYNKLANMGGNGGFFAKPSGSRVATEIDNGILIPLFIMIGLMFCTVAYCFGVALLSLVGRLINLWIAIIFAPFAFVSFIVPSARHIKGIGWEEWTKNLLKNAFSAPIYFFFILIISLLAQTSIIPENVSALSPGLLLVLVFLQFALIMMLLYQATKYVKEASGAIGEMVFKGAGIAAKVAGGVAGAGLGVAAGGAALLGRKYVGFLGKSFSENSERKALAAGEITDKFRKNNLWTAGKTDDEIKTDVKFRTQQSVAKKMVQVGRRAANASFDVRQTGLANFISDKTGVGFESVGLFATEKTAGGYNAKTIRDAAKKKAWADSLEGDHNEKLKLEEAAEKKEMDIKRKKAEIDIEKTQIPRGGTSVRLQKLTAELTMMQNSVPIERYNETEVQTGIDSGIDNPATGRPWTRQDIGTVKTQTSRAYNPHSGQIESVTYQHADLGTLKANGRAVTEEDINKTVKTDFLTENDLKKAADNSMKAMANSYLHYSMINSGYKVEGMKTDSMGNISQLGHYAHGPYGGVNQNALDMTRNFARAMRRIVGSTATGAAIGTVLLPGLGSIAGAITGGLGQAIREIRIGMGDIGASVRGQAAAAASLAGDPHFHPKEAKSTYKSPASGLFNMFKDLFKGGGGHDDHGGGDGGHSQGGGHH